MPPLLIPLILALAPSDPSWRYVVPPPDDPFAQGPFRALALGTERPEDVVEKVEYLGSRPQYTQLRFGSPNSVRVTVVLDVPDDPAEPARLYVDADRNRRIEPRDLVAPEPDGRTWRLPVDVATVRGELTDYLPRGLVFRRGRTGLTFSVAAAGYLEGTVEVDGRTHAVRRVDGDADGSLAGPQDPLWIDLGDDGRFDPGSELFLFAPILQVGDRRFAARSDSLGQRLALDRLEGTGTIRLDLTASVRPGARVASATATLVGRDGSVVTLNGDAPAVVPVGAYRLGTVAFTLDDPDGGPSWSFIFADSALRDGPVWHELAADATLVLDPIGQLDLRAGLEPDADTTPGARLDLQPLLYNGEGLLIVLAHRGVTPSPEGGPLAVISVLGPDDRLLTSARCGFS